MELVVAIALGLLTSLASVVGLIMVNKDIKKLENEKNDERGGKE